MCIPVADGEVPLIQVPGSMCVPPAFQSLNMCVCMCVCFGRGVGGEEGEISSSCTKLELHGSPITHPPCLDSCSEAFNSGMRVRRRDTSMQPFRVSSTSYSASLTCMCMYVCVCMYACVCVGECMCVWCVCVCG